MILQDHYIMEVFSLQLNLFLSLIFRITKALFYFFSVYYIAIIAV